jgi:hypothetical protein
MVSQGDVIFALTRACFYNFKQGNCNPRKLLEKSTRDGYRGQRRQEQGGRKQKLPPASHSDFISINIY